MEPIKNEKLFTQQFKVTVNEWQFIKLAQEKFDGKLFFGRFTAGVDGHNGWYEVTGICQPGQVPVYDPHQTAPVLHNPNGTVKRWKKRPGAKHESIFKCQKVGLKF